MLKIYSSGIFASVCSLEILGQLLPSTLLAAGVGLVTGQRCANPPATAAKYIFQIMAGKAFRMARVKNEEKKDLEREGLDGSELLPNETGRGARRHCFAPFVGSFQLSAKSAISRNDFVAPWLKPYTENRGACPKSFLFASQVSQCWSRAQGPGIKADSNERQKND